ncbi:helix-turn-helix domain-containing protein [Rhodocyclus tenuis]|uniref:Helix-turn-helix domain-containing protein n=1 Tax=Rhodocyclus gracilis TaxID=2929842 RepID=A0ABX0WJN6_9RHOO|nr:helix-turn-helix domain-containing protein [Rhodocyclus gracilis]NJA89935.1 helix-turn-helix domain-containing protein [Rhodocyclus gracilis]
MSEERSPLAPPEAAEAAKEASTTNASPVAVAAGEVAADIAEIAVSENASPASASPAASVEATSAPTVDAPAGPAAAELAAAVPLPLDVGGRLRSAREEKGLTLTEAAQSLKLSARQIAALESGDWSQLPGPTFVRGFLRNYARLLQIDIAPLLVALDAEQPVAPPPKLALPPGAGGTLPQDGRPERRDTLVVLGGLALVVLAFAVYFLVPENFWANRSANNDAAPATETSSPAEATPAEPVEAPATNEGDKALSSDADKTAPTVPAAAPASPVAAPAPSRELPKDPAKEAVAGKEAVKDTGIRPLATPAAPAAQAPAAASAPAPAAAASAKPTVPSFVVPTKPVSPQATATPSALPASPANAAASAAASKPLAAAAPSAPAASSTPPAASDAQLTFSFAQPSWVEVRDRSGQIVFSQLSPAGSERRVDGRPPFTLVVGNATHVTVRYKGKSVDLSPRSKDDVARLTLE